MPLLALGPGLEATLRDQPLLALVVLFGAGLATSLTPCVYPMIPITAGILGGAGSARRSRGRTLLLTAVYVLGLALVYSSLGLLAGLSGTLFGSVSSSPWALFLMGNLLLVFGLALLDVFTVNAPARLAAWAGRLAGDSVGGVFALGATSGLVAAPCGAPAFAAVLTFVSTTGSAAARLPVPVRLLDWSHGAAGRRRPVQRQPRRAPAGREVDPLDQAGGRSDPAGDGRVLLRQDGKRTMREACWCRRCSCHRARIGAALQAQESGIAVGAKAPVVTVRDLDGKSVDLGQYIGKKPIFLEFWATWCELCEELLPRVRAAKAAYGDQVEFFGVNVTVNQSRDRVRRYLEKHQPPFRTLYDEEGTSTRAYQAPATSYVVIVDRSGKSHTPGAAAPRSFDGVLRRVTQN